MDKKGKYVDSVKEINEIPKVTPLGLIVLAFLVITFLFLMSNFIKSIDKIGFILFFRDLKATIQLILFIITGIYFGIVFMRIFKGIKYIGKFSLSLLMKHGVFNIKILIYLVAIVSSLLLSVIFIGWPPNILFFFMLIFFVVALLLS